MTAFIRGALLLGILSCTTAHAADQPQACASLTAQLEPTGPPVFLASYPTVDAGPLHGVGFLYDDAVATVALVGCGEVGRASRIGDAILYALGRDRFWHDGRLRNGYPTGPVVGDPIKLTGWWDAAQNRWDEDSYQVGSDTGNMAWAMMALLVLDRAGAGSRYKDGAARVGAWIAGQADTRGAGGYTGGAYGWEPTPIQLLWKSTEHNTDIAAAFTLMAGTTGDPVWTARAATAAGLVQAMWNQECACFETGTTEDGETRNHFLALDAQIWPLLALAGKAQSPDAAALATVEARLRAHRGFSYSEAGRGFWTEGTAYVALLTRLSGRAEEATTLITGVEAERAPAGGYFATDVQALATGFGDPADPTSQRFYYHIPHLAAEAWAALAESGFDPFTATRSLPKAPPANSQ